MKRQTLYIFTLLLLFIKTLSAQNAGILDSTFNNSGIYTCDFGFHDNFNDITLQPDQKIICTGVAISPTFASELKILRLKTDGTLDSTFATNGIYTLLIGNECYGYESYVQPDGKIIVAGLTYDANYNGDWLLLRLDSTGTLDSTFGTNGITMIDFFTRDDIGQALAVQPDGKILMSGTCNDTINYYNNPTIVRFTENGIIDSTFGVNGFVIFPSLHIDNELTSIAIQANGKIVAAGHYSPVFTGAMNFDVLVIRVDTNGVPDATFGNNGVVTTPINGGIDDSFGMDIDTAQNIIVGGFTTLPFTLTLDMALLKYKSDGSLDSTFGTAGIVTFDNDDVDYANDLKIDADNKIVVAGSTGVSFSGPSYFAIWRYLSNGIPDSTFGTNGFVTTAIDNSSHEATSILLQADGKIVASGKYRNSTTNNNDVGVVRYNNSIVNSIAEINSENKIFIYPNPAFANQIITINSVNELSSKTQIEIFDLLENKIFSSRNLKFSDKNFQIKLPENLSSGIYFISVSDAESMQVQKLIVQ